MADLGPKKVKSDGVEAEQFSQAEQAANDDRTDGNTTLKAANGGWKNVLRMSRAKPANPAD